MFGERSFIMFVSIMIASLIVAPQPFDVENLGCISDGQCFSQAMNESGQVAGYGDAPNGMANMVSFGTGMKWSTSFHSIIQMAEIVGRTASTILVMLWDIQATAVYRFTPSFGMAGK
jgi:hypothetical protein